jgi:ATP-dependent protease ClpP protease subunit
MPLRKPALKNSLVWSGDIEEAFLGALIEYLTNRSQKQPGTIILNSKGGDPVIAANSRYWLHRFKPFIIATGHCLSAAFCVMGSGMRGRRWATPGTRFMYHATSMSLQKSYLPEIERELRETEFEEDQLIKDLGLYTNRKYNWWKEQLQLQPVYFGATRALEVGLIDGILK